MRTVVLGAALTLGAAHFDRWVGRNSDGYEDLEESSIDAGDIFGNGAQLAGLSGLAWGTGLLARKPALARTGREMVEALTIDAAAVTALKLIVGRKRPDGSNSLSFPSGHTSGAFAVSTVVWRRGGWKLGVPAYGLSALTATARVEDHKHYLSDVVAGATIGIVVGQIVAPRVAPARPGRPALVATSSGVGLRISF